MRAAPSLEVQWLGRVRYADGLARQEALVAARARDAGSDTLLLLEHAPVITLGRSSDPAHVLLPAAELARRGIERFETGRGGDVTYHGPGQLVGYPILKLAAARRDAHRYLRELEQTLIAVAGDFGIAAGRIPGLTGVWVGEDKLAAIGVKLSTGWITSHGFALNVGRDLSGFGTIVPCGLTGHGVTSLGRLLGYEPELEAVAGRTALRLAERFELRLDGAARRAHAASGGSSR
ncbi:MAG TPA: lipoyl(octanoyl) transferase LipB [Candidatus Polarisedimenticolaceae bacterium]|nr:lipoyl(octanoyl) transferase LipB [Candidatus Polarisedimenticolaceae bacterium]